MYLEVSAHPPTPPEPTEPSRLPSSNRDERFSYSDCGRPLWLMLTDSDRYLISWILLELNEVDRRRLMLTAEIYTGIQPAF